MTLLIIILWLEIKSRFPIVHPQGKLENFFFFLSLRKLQADFLQEGVHVCVWRGKREEFYRYIFWLLFFLLLGIPNVVKLQTLKKKKKKLIKFHFYLEKCFSFYSWEKLQNPIVFLREKSKPIFHKRGGGWVKTKTFL